jgi:peptidoglycan/xylan/chitin deacetylase (PgdA/CDA1 family)
MTTPCAATSPSPARWAAARVLRAIAACAIGLVAASIVAPPRAHAETRHQTVVSITFDDGFASQMAAAPILERYGFHGTFYVNSELLNGVDRLSTADVRALAAAGNEIGGHTSDHTDLITVDPAERLRQVCDDRIAIAKIVGRSPRSFAYPYGASNLATEHIVRRCGYSSARTVGSLYNESSCPSCPHAETLVPHDGYRVRTSFSFVSTTPVGDAERAITAAAEHGGGWVPLVFHQVCDTCSALAVRPARLQALLAWIKTQRSHGVVVRTMGAVVGGAALPLLRSPKQTGPYGRLQNPHLSQPGAVTGSEPGAQGDGVDTQEATRCWRRAGYGVNHVSWTRGHAGINGSIAETAVVTGYKSGDNKLIVRRDGGSCSILVRPGSTYMIAVWDRASTPVSLTTYTRTAAGSWSYWGKSPAAHTSKGWSELSYKLPSVPAGVTDISFGAAIAGNGRMTLDDFRIVRTRVAAKSSGGLAGSRALVGLLLIGLLVVPVLGAAVYDRVRRRRAAA